MTRTKSRRTVAREEQKVAGKPFTEEPTGKARYYRDTISLPAEITLGTARSVLERIREYGWAKPNSDFSRVDIEFEADDDWDLREQLAEIETELRSWDIDFTVDKTKMRTDPVPLPQNVIELLARIEWVQQRNNSVAECPECGGINDGDEQGDPIFEGQVKGHEPGCLLKELIG